MILVVNFVSPHTNFQNTPRPTRGSDLCPTKQILFFNFLSKITKKNY